MTEKQLKKERILRLLENSLNIKRKKLTSVRRSLDDKATGLEIRERKLKKEEDIKSNKVIKALDLMIKEKTLVNKTLENRSNQFKKLIKGESSKLLSIEGKEAQAAKTIKEAKESKIKSNKEIRDSNAELNKNKTEEKEILRTVKILNNDKRNLDKNITSLESTEKKLKDSISLLEEKTSSKKAHLKRVKTDSYIALTELKEVQREANRAIKDLEKAEVSKEKALNDVKKEKAALGIQKNKNIQETAGVDRLKKSIKFYVRRMNKWYRSKGLKEPIKLNF